MCVGLMTTLLVSCAALHLAPTTTSIAKLPAVARRAAGVVMDEETESYNLPFPNVTAAAADIQEVLIKEGFSAEVAPDVTAAAADINEMLAQESYTDAPASPYFAVGQYLSPEESQAAARAAWLAKTYGVPPSAVPQAAEASLPPPTTEIQALLDEQNELYEELAYGYDAPRVQRLAEVEALLAEASYADPTETAELSPEEAAKAAWLARNSQY